MLVFNIAPEIEKSMQSTPGAKFNSYAASLFGLPRYSIDMHGLGGSYEYLAATIYRFKSELSIPAARGWSSIPLSFLIVALLLVILIGLGTLTKIR